MSFLLLNSATISYSATSGSSVVPFYPNEIVAGSALILIVGQKPSVANGGTVTTPAGWNPLGSVLAAGGYGATLGVDTGNTNLFFYSFLATGAETGSLSVTVGNNSVCWAQIIEIRKGFYDAWTLIALVSGSDAVAGNVAVAVASQTYQAGDICVYAFVAATDVNSGVEYSAHQLTVSGVGFTASTEIAEAGSSNGNNVGGFTAYAYVNTGGTAVATIAAVAAAANTNIRGPGAILVARAATSASRYGDFLSLM